MNTFAKKTDEYIDKLSIVSCKGENLLVVVVIKKKMYHLINAGGRRALLELLPTVAIGRALPPFFSYKRFESRHHETVQYFNLSALWYIL